MEVILTLVAVWLGYSIFIWFIGAVFGTTKAVVKSAVGKGSLSENLEYEFKGLGPFQIRIVEKNMWEEMGGAKDDPKYKVLVIEGRGLPSHSYKTHLGFVTSVLDDTGDEPAPIMSMMDGFKEKESGAYQHIVDAGKVESGHGYGGWGKVGGIFTSFLYPPEGGKRLLKIVFRIVNMDDFPNIHLGFCSEEDNGVIDTLVADASFYFDGNGFLETAENENEAKSEIIKLAMSVAMADGSLDDSEGNAIKHWIKKAIAPFSGKKKEQLKKIYNDALRTSYQEAKSGDLSVSGAVERLEELAETPQKYEAIELCFEVMAADGVADENEIKKIKGIAEGLGLDFDEIEKLRDKHLVGMELSMEQASIETILNIDPNWSNEKIKKHLAVEFAKWNNRLNTLAEGQERENAQKMLDLIAEGRKKYA